MIGFIVIAMCLTAVAVGFVVIPFMRATRAQSDATASSASTQSANSDPSLDILRGELRELELERERGELSGDQYQVAVTELQRRVLSEVHASDAEQSGTKAVGSGTTTLAVLALAIPILSGTLYWYLGAPGAIDAKLVKDDATPSASQIEAGVAEARKRIEADPKDARAWMMLARGEIIGGRDEQAVRAYEEVLKLQPSEPEPYLELAELLARQQKTLEGRPTQLIETALQVSPQYWKALALSGRAAFDRGDYATAVQRWEALKGVVPKDSQALVAIEQGLAEARARLTGKSESVPVAQGDNAVNSNAGSVSGTVSIDESMRARAQAEDTVFIFARLSAGPPMPLAVLRKQVKDLPLEFSLDDSMAMSPQLRISSAKELIVEARISKSGDAMPKSGDIKGTSAVIAPGSTGVQVRIDSVVP